MADALRVNYGNTRYIAIDFSTLDRSLLAQHISKTQPLASTIRRLKQAELGRIVSHVAHFINPPEDPECSVLNLINPKPLNGPTSLLITFDSLPLLGKNGISEAGIDGVLIEGRDFKDIDAKLATLQPLNASTPQPLVTLCINRRDEELEVSPPPQCELTFFQDSAFKKHLSFIE